MKLKRIFKSRALVCKRMYGVKPTRGDFSQIEEKDLDKFKEIVSSQNVVTEKEELEKYNTDWMKKYKGKSSLALLPKTTQQVSQILSYCNQRKLAVVPQGGNTGLVGGRYV